MSSDMHEYVRYRVSRSEEAFRVAQRALQEDNLHEAVGRLYYSCFHLVSALLLVEGRSSKRHGGIWTLFDIHWVKAERLPKEMGRFFHRLYRRRQDADYADNVTFRCIEVAGWFQEASSFIDLLRGQIDTLLEADQQE